MDDEPAAFTSASEPAPVTSAASPEDPAGAPLRRRHTTLGVVAAIIVFDLLVAAGVWYSLSPNGGTSAVGPVTSPVEVALRERVATEYPGFTVTRVTSSELDYSADAGGGKDWIYYFDMQNREDPGFTYTAQYFAELSRKDEPIAYANRDAFFLDGTVPAATVASFMHMWPYAHPGEKVLSASITWDSAEATQTCVVDYARLEKTGTSITSTTGAYVYAYWPKTDTWTQLRSEQIAAPSQVDITEGYATPMDDGSLPDTQAAVAHALPGFKAIGVATHPNGDLMIVVGSTKYPGLRMAVDGIYLNPPDPDTEDMVKLFGGDRVRADAFARAWSSAHRGAVIDLLYFDPEATGDTNLLDVSYVKSIAQVDDIRYEKDVEYRYHPKTHVWTKAK